VVLFLFRSCEIANAVTSGSLVRAMSNYFVTIGVRVYLLFTTSEIQNTVEITVLLLLNRARLAGEGGREIDASEQCHYTS